MTHFASDIVKLPQLNVEKGQSSVSGLSSGAFMTVQLHLAHSASFTGAGVIAGGPYRGVETFRGSALITEDAWEINAMQLCMAPLTPELAPDARKSVQLAQQTERDLLIDPLSNMARQRMYIFTGSKDSVVMSPVVAQTREMYRLLGVPEAQIHYDDSVPAGHSLLTANPEDNALGDNKPPYLNRGPFVHAHAILQHIYPDSKAPALNPTGKLLRFDQRDFFDSNSAASMSEFGYVYIPQAVLDGAAARVHIAIHGCKQGSAFVNYSFGNLDSQDQPPYGMRYITSTGYIEFADANNLIILFPQVTGSDSSQTQNPDGCWDWWGYSSKTPGYPDYFSKKALQIQAIHAMLTRLGG